MADGTPSAGSSARGNYATDQQTKPVTDADGWKGVWDWGGGGFSRPEARQFGQAVDKPTYPESAPEGNAESYPNWEQTLNTGGKLPTEKDVSAGVQMDYDASRTPAQKTDVYKKPDFTESKKLREEQKREMKMAWLPMLLQGLAPHSGIAGYHAQKINQLGTMADREEQAAITEARIENQQTIDNAARKQKLEELMLKNSGGKKGLSSTDGMDRGTASLHQADDGSYLKLWSKTGEVEPLRTPGRTQTSYGVLAPEGGSWGGGGHGPVTEQMEPRRPIKGPMKENADHYGQAHFTDTSGNVTIVTTKNGQMLNRYGLGEVGHSPKSADDLEGPTKTLTPSTITFLGREAARDAEDRGLTGESKDRHIRQFMWNHTVGFEKDDPYRDRVFRMYQLDENGPADKPNRTAPNNYIEKKKPGAESSWDSALPPTPAAIPETPREGAAAAGATTDDNVIQVRKGVRGKYVIYKKEG